jgi:FkbM family methyltransferase
MHPVVAALDRPGTRPLVAHALRRRIRRLYGVRVGIRYDATERLWLFRWPGVVAPMLEPVATSPWDFERAHADVFFQEYTPEAGDVIVDLGAGMGSELDLMSRLVGPAGAVYAVEADPQTYRCLELRRELNGLANALPIHAAISDRVGEAMIGSEGHHLGHRVVEDGPGHRVPATTLDALVAEHGISRIDLLKVNVEGSEAAAFQGMRESIGLVRHVAVSCHDFMGRPTGAAVRAFLAAHGFALSGRRAEDTRDWARSWLYASR